MTYKRNPSVSTESTCICYHKLITLATLLRLSGGAVTSFPRNSVKTYDRRSRFFLRSLLIVLLKITKLFWSVVH